jgi:hypothetical protein
MTVTKASHQVPSATTINRLRSHRERMVNNLLKRVDAQFGWYRALSAQDRSYVALVASASIGAFITWCERPDASPPSTSEIFDVAPRELTKAVSLQHTLQLVRAGVDVLEEDAETLSAPGRADELRAALLRYSREFAFTAAEVYARAAELRGSWDARLEALLVDGLMRGEHGRSLISRASAVGWKGEGKVLAVVAGIPRPLSADDGARLRRAIRLSAPDTLFGAQSDRVLLVLGGPGDLREAVDGLTPFLSDRTVIGPTVEGLDTASRSVLAASAGLDALSGWPGAPTPVLADDLLPERVLGGDATARVTLIEQVYGPLADAGGDLVATLWAYIEAGRSLEASARALYVHPNTVRYRLRKVADVCGWDPSDPRESYVLHTALTVGRLAGG